MGNTCKHGKDSTYSEDVVKVGYNVVGVVEYDV
jgi:hypothetical protein